MFAAKFSCSTVGLKVTRGRARESTHLLRSVEQEAAKEPQTRSVSHLHVGKQPAASDVFRRFKYQRADDPLPPAPVRPAAGSETHFLAQLLKVALQTHKQEAALFHVPPLHAAHVKAREAGRCARVSWSGVRCRILSLCCLSCHHSRNKTEGRFSPSPRENAAASSEMRRFNVAGRVFDH